MLNGSSTHGSVETVKGTSNGFVDLSNGSTDSQHNGHRNGCSEDAPSSQPNAPYSSDTHNALQRHAQRLADAMSCDGPKSIEEDFSLRERPSPAPVAICGMSMRLPGGVNDATSFWDLLATGQDAKGPIPADRYHISSYGNPSDRKYGITDEHGYFISSNIASLDTSFFSMSREEVQKADPQQRQLLEVTRECLENAGEVDYRGKAIGCFIGTFGEDWLRMISKEPQHVGSYITTGHSDIMLANRISYEFDINGPSMVIKTGCSASLTALHQACRALQNDDCSAAIVGGSSIIMDPAATESLAREGILSPNVSCKSFDASADGYARAEAVTAIYVKLLDDALRDGNPIRAVIRNTACNSDGKSASLMAPNARSHEQMITKAYRDCRLNPADTPFVECHGTGTATGDPIEVGAVANVFGDRGVFIGSVKPNIGHSEGASGLSSVIKAVLSLEQGAIPPNIKFNTPNPRIPFREQNLIVPTTLTAWPEGRPKRISVNSFGIGGANAHIILDAYEETTSVVEHTEIATQKTPTMLLYSANTAESLTRLIEDHRSIRRTSRHNLRDLAYTMALRREHLSHRAYELVDNNGPISLSQIAKIPAKPRSLVMVFTGQGAQWPGMGASLIQSEPEFREDIKFMDLILESLHHPPKWTIEGELMRDSVNSMMHKAEIAQPLTTAVQIALTHCFLRAGVRPTAVVGHSSGEIAAAYASGMIPLRMALALAYYRGLATKSVGTTGGMAAVGMSADDVRPFLDQDVVVACENSPVSTTISGNPESIQRSIVAMQSQNPELMTRVLKVDQAYHSPFMGPVGKQYLKYLHEEQVKTCTIDEKRAVFVSSVTGQPIEIPKALGAAYWNLNLTSAVRFSSAIGEITSLFPDPLFLEIGPHSTLAGPIRQTCSSLSISSLYVASMVRNSDPLTSLLSAFGQLYQESQQLQMSRIIAPGKVIKDLPSYPWDHAQEYWYESRLSKEGRYDNFGRHPLLGTRTRESSDLHPSWRSIIDLEDLPWIRDHRVNRDVVMPFAVYCSMAGEAVRQIHRLQGGYSLRDIVVHKAMVLTENEPMEVVTTLHAPRSTDTIGSDYWEFTILSNVSGLWIKHCDGRVKSLQTDLPSRDVEKGTMARVVDANRFYEALANVGFNFGPTFRKLGSVRSSTSKPLASAVIGNDEMHRDSAFVFHPTAIDACLQLAIIANSRGNPMAKLMLPTRIRELDVGHDAATMRAISDLDGTDDGVSVSCQDGESTALRLYGMHLIPLSEDGGHSAVDKYGAAKLEWRALFDFADHSLLFDRPEIDVADTLIQEEMTFLCMVDSAERISGLTPAQPHLENIRRLITEDMQKAKDDSHPMLTNGRALMQLSPEDRRNRIKECATKLMPKSRCRILAVATQLVWENIEGIFTGTHDILEMLTEDRLLTEIYSLTSMGHSGFIQLLSHARPTLRILEVGAGTGGTTQTFLRNLISNEGFPQYSTYTFTDVSAGFFVQAKERFSYAPNMEFKVFDISRTPFEQGFEAESYDLILAPNVIHATPVLQDTLRNIRPLLKPGGYMVLTEINTETQVCGYVFGGLPGWWLGIADGRISGPGASVDRWDRELKDSGFTGAETVVYDSAPPYQLFAVIVTRAQMTLPNHSTCRTITIVSSQPDSEQCQGLSAAFLELGCMVSVCNIGEDIPSDRDCVSLLDLETEFLLHLTDERLRHVQDFLNTSGNRKVLYLTKPAQVNCQDPNTALSIGFTRTARVELGIDLYTLEIDATAPAFTSVVTSLFEKISSAGDKEELSPDYEYVYENGVIQVGRYLPYSIERLAKNSASASSESSIRLEVMRPGQLSSLTWTESPHQDISLDGHVQIDVNAVSINHLDILYVSNLTALEQSAKVPGLEAAGTIIDVGPGVEHLKVGDRVATIARSGCLASKLSALSSMVVKIPDDLEFEAAATMPFAFVTALHAILRVGRLEQGQSVLIHCASSGIGHAAIQIFKSLGATIFATAGNQDKIDYLVETHGINRAHIFDSRTDSFEHHLLSATGRKGVDFILNSHPGNFVQASWRCLANFGTFVDLRPRGPMSDCKLNLDPTPTNKSYCSVDMLQLIEERPAYISKLLQETFDGHRTRRYSPLSHKVLDATEITHAFELISRGESIGKTVVKPILDSNTEIVPSIERLMLNAKASYLFTGGLGGLGRSIARRMVERGATSIIFLSPSAGDTPLHLEAIAELEDMGCEVLTVKGLVQCQADVQRAIESTEREIKGIIHFAMVLKDAQITEMTTDNWHAAIEPKVEGAKVLEAAFQDHELDFFVLASSVMSFNHQPGQANYVAANTFLEAFCQARRGRGLAASVVNIPPIEGIGFVAQNSIARKNLKAAGLQFLDERRLLDIMELAMHPFRPSASPDLVGASPVDMWASEGQIILGLRAESSLDQPSSRIPWRRDRRMGIYHNIHEAVEEVAQTAEFDELQAFLARAAVDQSLLSEASGQAVISEAIGRKVLGFLMRPNDDISLGVTLEQLGLDSLIAIELRRWWRQVFGVDVSVLEILASGTLERLGRMAAEGLIAKGV